MSRLAGDRSGKQGQEDMGRSLSLLNVVYPVCPHTSGLLGQAYLWEYSISEMLSYNFTDMSRIR
ncbi:hypothetical protein [Sulfuracidifex tepidarius]|uniref:hypothetical protein n=1 Tax=Sulfuracidifex tepidarius TaxID=1294262 RepID=UPI0011F1450C|nr:hypothetical protein [Sulfuracidifex tepidarius]